MIPIWVCCFWLAVGLVAGSVGMLMLIGYATEARPDMRRRYLRELVKRYPLDYEAALNAHDLIHPASYVVDRNAHFDPIDFKVCDHCELPWPLAGDVLEGHTQIDDRGKIVAAVCPGSGTREYHDGEA